ncbi:mucin-5AC [Sphaeramia orbicularis]|uniref:mucin-5AC n=1 Tax=Sphaeramia orbicularis TaxID=375764 RepID=UPI00117E3CDA|nr:mucin-5AC-like [Sphaeramia orbicularis]
MSPLFMDSGYDYNSPGSESAEDSHSNTGGSEREDGRPSSNRGSKRRQKNRDAARKSRRKQTERADELHEELQRLERSNSALEKEIKILKRDLHVYTITLERHEPHCCIKASGSGSSSSSHLMVSTSQAPSSSSSPKTSSQTSGSTLAPLQPISSALTSNLSLRGLDSLLPPPTLASSPELFDTSCSPPPPYSFPTVPAAHSLFSKENVITPLPLDAAPICTGLVSNPLPSTDSQPHSRQDTVRQRSSAAANPFCQLSDPGVFSTSSYTVPVTLHSAAPQTLQTSNVVPPYLHLRPPAVGSAGLEPPLFPPHPNTLSPPCALLSSSFQDPALQLLSVSPQTNLEHPPAPTFDLKPTQHQQTPPNPTPLLSFLTVPSPINVHQTTSSDLDGSSVETSSDLSLSKLLEGNDWILSGN